MNTFVILFPTKVDCNKIRSGMRKESWSHYFRSFFLISDLIEIIVSSNFRLHGIIFLSNCPLNEDDWDSFNYLPGRV